MESEIRGADLFFRYRMIDIRELDGDHLLESEETGDNIIAILALTCRRRNGKPLLGQLLILAGLRRLEETVEREIQKMPVYIDISENKVLGPAYREGQRTVIRLEKRFGPMPAWAEERLASRSANELEDLAVRVLDAQSIEDLFK